MPILIVEARFYPDIADELRNGATEALNDAGVSHELVAVSGALEIPGAIRFALDSMSETDGIEFGGFVALGCIIRGDTSHYEHVAGECMHGLATFAARDGIALGNGVLTCENQEQAWQRARTNGGNKGGTAARVVLEMMDLKRRLGAWGTPNNR